MELACKWQKMDVVKLAPVTRPQPSAILTRHSLTFPHPLRFLRSRPILTPALLMTRQRSDIGGILAVHPFHSSKNPTPLGKVSTIESVGIR